MPSARFRDTGRDGRAAALDQAARAGQPLGVLAHLGDEAVGWCSIAPRESYAAVLAPRVIPSVPGDGIWSVVCFFMAAQVRRRGLLPLLLEAACRYAGGVGRRRRRGLPVARRRQLPVHGHA